MSIGAGLVLIVSFAVLFLLFLPSTSERLKLNSGLTFFIGLVLLALLLRLDITGLSQAPKVSEQVEKKQMTSSTSFIGIAECQNTIKKVLRDPRSAQFRNVYKNEFGYVCGHVNAKNGFGGYTGWTPFSCSPTNRSSLGVSCGARGEDIIFDFIASENPEGIRRAVAAGMSLSGTTFIHHAIKNARSYDVIVALIESGASVSNYKDGYTPLHLATRYHSDPRVVKALLNAGAEVDAIDQSYTPSLEGIRGGTPLHNAARYRSEVAIVDILIEAGADVNFVDGWGNTPIFDAVNNWDDVDGKIATRLIEGGAEVNFVNAEGKSPLGRAARLIRNPAIIKILLDSGANIDSDSGYTPLHSAAFMSRSAINTAETIKLLIAAGAELDKIDRYGRTPLDIAKEYDVTPAIQELEKALREQKVETK